MSNAMSKGVRPVAVETTILKAAAPSRDIRC